MSFMIPLRFSSGVVRNIKQLKEKFPAHLNEIAIFINSGELERFFQVLGRGDLKDLISTMKKEGKSHTEILKELAGKLGVEIDHEECKELQEDDYVRPGDTLKDILESDREIHLFPSGRWSASGQINIKQQKKIKGTGCDKSAIIIDEILVDILEGQEVEISSFTIKRGENSSGLLIIKNGNLRFKDVVFEDVRVFVHNRGKAEFENGAFAFTPAFKGDNISAINLMDDGEADISLNTGFEKIEFPVKIWEASLHIKEFEEIRKKSGHIFNKSSIISWFNEGLLEFRNEFLLFFTNECILQRDITLREPILIKDKTYSIEGVGEVKILSPAGQAFIVEKGTLSLKNLRVNPDASSPNGPLIAVTDGKVTVDNCELKGGLICLSSKNSTVNLKASRIEDSKDSGIVLESSSAEMLDSYIVNNKRHGLFATGSSKVKLDKCEIMKNGSSGIYIENSELFMDSTVIADSVDGSGLNMTGAKATVQNCKINGNKGNGVVITNNSFLKITDCEIMKNDSSGESYPQVGLENSELFMDSTVIADSVNADGLYMTGAKATVQNCKINGNLWHGIETNNSFLILKKSQVLNNSYLGLDIYKKSEVQIFDAHIAGNRGPELIFKSGTQISISGDSSLSIKRSKIDGPVKSSTKNIKVEDSEIRGGIKYE